MRYRVNVSQYRFDIGALLLRNWAPWMKVTSAGLRRWTWNITGKNNAISAMLGIYLRNSRD
jgi:hypothetical protein